MRMKPWFPAAVAAAVMAGRPAGALDAGVSAKVGTLGFGGELTVNAAKDVNLRAGFNGFNYDRTESVEEAGQAVDLDIAIDLRTVMALVDWHPRGNEFRLTGGMVFNDNKGTASAPPDTLVEIGDGEYRVADAYGEVTFADLCAYVGIGYGNAAAEGPWHFAFDLGVMFQGKPDVAFRATAEDPRLQPLLDADIQREIDDIKDDTDSFTLYPVLSFGVSYAF